MEYHLTKFPANNVWPNGGWSVYAISADEISMRIKRNDQNDVIERHAWSGFIGCFENLRHVSAAIAQHQQDTE